MTCKCNCHDPGYREDTNTPEHATHEDCRRALAEEEARFAEIERWFDDFVASGGQRPFRDAR